MERLVKDSEIEAQDIQVGQSRGRVERLKKLEKLKNHDKETTWDTDRTTWKSEDTAHVGMCES